MMAAIKRFFRRKAPNPPVTYDFSGWTPPRENEKEREIRETQTEFVQALMAAQRTAVDARRELARSTLAIVSGDRLR